MHECKYEKYGKGIQNNAKKYKAIQSSAGFHQMGAPVQCDVGGPQEAHTAPIPSGG